MRYLRARLLQKAQDEAQAKEAAARRSQLGTGDRSEKIRTYNFPDGRVTDHRIKHTSHQLQDVLAGGEELDEFVDRLNARRTGGPARRGRTTVIEARRDRREADHRAGRPPGGRLPRPSRRREPACRPPSCSWPTCSGPTAPGCTRGRRDLASAAGQGGSDGRCAGGVPARRPAPDRRAGLPPAGRWTCDPGCSSRGPETEILVERALDRSRAIVAPRRRRRRHRHRCDRARDRGRAPRRRVLAIDVSPEAVALARENAAALGSGRRDRRRRPPRPCPPPPAGRVDLVVSNPPYVAVDAVATSRARCAPIPAALVGGDRARTGRSRIRQSSDCVPGGALVVEIGETQAAEVSDVVRSAGFVDVERRAGPHRPRPGRDGAAGREIATRSPTRRTAVRDGGLIVFPTDTVYGIGSRPDDPGCDRSRVRGEASVRATSSCPVLCPTIDAARRGRRVRRPSGRAWRPPSGRARSRWCCRGHRSSARVGPGRRCR